MAPLLQAHTEIDLSQSLHHRGMTECQTVERIDEMKRTLIALIGLALALVVAVTVSFIDLKPSEPTVQRQLPLETRSARILIGPLAVPVAGRDSASFEFVQLILVSASDDVVRLCSLEPRVLEAVNGYVMDHPLKRSSTGGVTAGAALPYMQQAIVDALHEYVPSHSIIGIEVHAKSAVIPTKQHMKLLNADYRCDGGKRKTS
jgi:hypothetical protein